MAKTKLSRRLKKSRGISFIIFLILVIGLAAAAIALKFPQFLGSSAKKGEVAKTGGVVVAIKDATSSVVVDLRSASAAYSSSGNETITFTDIPVGFYTLTGLDNYSQVCPSAGQYDYFKNSKTGEVRSGRQLSLSLQAFHKPCSSPPQESENSSIIVNDGNVFNNFGYDITVSIKGEGRGWTKKADHGIATFKNIPWKILKDGGAYHGDYKVEASSVPCSATGTGEYIVFNPVNVVVSSSSPVTINLAGVGKKCSSPTSVPTPTPTSRPASTPTSRPTATATPAPRLPNGSDCTSSSQCQSGICKSCPDQKSKCRPNGYICPN